MLTSIGVDNFAVIDHLQLNPVPGLTVLTGETGAGKSIIIDALQAALGERASADVVRYGEQSASVEAILDLPALEPDDELIQLLEEYGVEHQELLALRREINSAGRSTARLNGKALPVSDLSSIAALLVDIHGQSEHLSLLKPSRQLEALDRFGSLFDLRNAAGEAIAEWNRLKREQDELLAGSREAEQRVDLLRFQVEEIEAADLDPSEEAELSAERGILVNAQRLVDLASSAYSELAEEGGPITRTSSAASRLKELSEIDADFVPQAARLAASKYELEDLAEELRRYRDRVEYDPRRLEAIDERLDLLARLKRKYGASLEEVIAFSRRSREALDAVENLEERVAQGEERARAAEEKAGMLCKELSDARHRIASELAEAMRAALQDLGLKHVRFEVRLDKTEAEGGLLLPETDQRFRSTASGIDQISFRVSFNPGEPLRPLEKVASGGETSRFLLALKSVLAGADRIPTLVFDEIDVGVGGRHGIAVGEKLQQLSRMHQVIAITHLPQIAALADRHIKVGKSTSEGRSLVTLEVLEGPERVHELAEMMSGTGTEAAKRSAQELLDAASHKP